VRPGEAHAIGRTAVGEDRRLILIDEIGKARQRAELGGQCQIGEDIVAADRLQSRRAEAVAAVDSQMVRSDQA